MVGSRVRDNSGRMRKLVTLCFLISLTGCFSLFNPWSGGKKDDPNVNTVGGRVFKTGSATFAKWDTMLDVDRSIAHEEQKGDHWMVGNNVTTGKVARNGFTFIIRKKAAGETLAHFLVKEHHVDQAQASLIQQGELFGVKGAKLDNVIGAKFQNSMMVAIESGNCFYSLYVYSWGKDGTNGDYRMLMQEAQAGLRGTSGPVPTPTICK